MSQQAPRLALAVVAVGMASLLAPPTTAGAADRNEARLEAGWKDPPLDARTRAFWWWLNGNVTKAAITRDLEEMRAKGMGGALLFDADGSGQRGNRRVPAGPLFGSEAWRELFVHAVREAARLKLELSLSIQSGWNLGGPDVTPAEAAKQVTWSELKVSTPGRLARKLAQPSARSGFYRDIAVLAFRDRPQTAAARSIAISANGSQEGFPPALAADGDLDSFWVSDGDEPGDGPKDGEPEWLALTFEKPVTVSAIDLLGRKDYGPKRCRVEFSRDGRSFTTATEEFAVANGKTIRQRFEPVTATHFRLAITAAYDPRHPNAPRNAQVVEFDLLGAGRRSLVPRSSRRLIRDLRAKSMSRELGGSAPDCRPLLFDFPVSPSDAHVALADVIDLSDRLAPDGTLDWEVPAGAWTILRFGYTPTGAHVSTSSGDWQGAVVDYMSEAVLRAYWTRHVRPLLELVRPHCGTALKYVETDSWECGGMNWSPGFETKFAAYLGYDPIPWLPVLAGKIVANREASNAFLADFRKAIAHCVADDHYRVLGELADEFGIGTQPECSGPHAGPLDGLKNYGRSDLAMSEFWRPSPHRPRPQHRFFVKQAASAAHTYGMKLVGAEGFTSIGPHWNDSFWRDLKPSFDHEACDGLNLTFVHTFTCSPVEMGMPGQEYFAGTHFNPNCTWWPMAGAFIAYMNRCHWMLQQGRFVADVAYYYGDHVPNIARRKADDPAGVLPGHDYDVISEEILGRLAVRGGRLTLPTGMEYRVLVLPDHRVLSLTALRKVRELVAAGATVCGPRPERAVSLVGGAAGAREFEQIAATVWDANRPEHAIANKMPIDVLRQLDVEPAFAHDGGYEVRLEWIQRTTPAGELYFVANQAESPATIRASFRVSGRQPELWNPMDGSRRDAVAYEQKEGRTIVPLSFAPNGAIFVLFRCAIPPRARGAAVSNTATYRSLLGLTGPWTVQFDPAWGGPKSTEFETLTDWTLHADPGIRYYSGIATYRMRFDAPGSVRRARIDLGDVLEMAEVRLNGRSLGVVWAPPFAVDVSGALKPGENTLEIRVANQWTNRIVGDLRLPPAERRTRTNITRLTASSPLLPSGLLGPVTLQAASGSP